MLSSIIGFLLSDVPLWTLILAIVLAFIHTRFKQPRLPKISQINIYLNYLFFLAVGLVGIWGFIMHCGFPNQAASFIGWHNSPFQWEVGIANLAMGLCGIWAARASVDFQKATTLFLTVFLWGAAVGHIKQMIAMHNFNPGNAGAIFWVDIITPIILVILVATKNTLVNKNIQNGD